MERNEESPDIEAKKLTKETHIKTRPRFYTKELLEKYAPEAVSVRNLLQILGKSTTSGSTQVHVANLLKKYEIDISHFLGQGHMKGKVAINRLTPSEVLILHPPGSPKKKRKVLKRALISSGVPYLCKICSSDPTWNNKELVLQIDHKNGNPLDNRIHNLRFLCPNCHSQTETYGRTKN